MKRVLALSIVLAAVSLPTPGMAAEIDQLEALVQGQFRDLSEDLAASLSYKAVAPVEPLGITGFDIGIETTATKLRHKDTWEEAADDDVPSTLIVPKIHLHKGLPLGIDLGAFYASVPGSNISISGAELRYALVEGGVATPAIALRATYSKLSGVDDLNFKTQGFEIGISKGFAFFTPYAGIGRVWVTSTPDGDAEAAGLDEEEFSVNKTFVGANFNFGLMNIGIEGDKTGDATTYAFKFGWRF